MNNSGSLKPTEVLQLKPPRRSIDGILLLNKPYNISSNTALQQVKRLFNAKKAGHTGSLDPLATGVLPICLGEATKFSGYLLDADKFYTAWGRLGFTSPTGDAEGELTPVENAASISRTQFEEHLQSFIGEIKQIPPIYSALKKDGVPLYKLARRGQALDTQVMEEKARVVTILDIHLNHFSYPDFEIKVHCSKGTYIRTLVEDIGKSLNSGAYLLNLRRDKAGPYEIENSYTIEQLTAFTVDTRDSLLLPIDTSIEHFPVFTLNSGQVTSLRQGKVIDIELSREKKLSEPIMRLYTYDNIFIGLGKISPEGKLSVQRLISFL